MLVLTRKKGERVTIGEDIVITILEVRGDGVRIGFDAPCGVSIQRDELLRVPADTTLDAESGVGEGE